MHQLTLVIGNCRYSSWSLRAWLMAKQSNLTFATKLIPFAPEYHQYLAEYAPARTVPILVDDGLVVAQSLAIGLHLHGLSPNSGILPDDKQKLAVAMDLSAEMISSFGNLRQQCPMDLQLQNPNFNANDAVLADIARLERIWGRAKNQFGAGVDFLVGKYCIVEVMFTPVATRIKTYNLPVSPLAQNYCQQLLQHKWYQEWHTMGLAETYNYH